MTTDNDEIAAIEEKAKMGDAEAQYKLGSFFEKGKVFPQNQREAVRWYGLAADQGHTDARARLGKMHASGKGAPQNYKEAYIWFSLAAMDGNEEYAKERDAMGKELTPYDLSVAQGEAKARDEEVRRNISERKEMASIFSTD